MTSGPISGLVGSRVPAFEGLTPEGKRIHVDEYQGRKLWIMLYRYVGCPLCAAHLRQVHQRLPFLREHGVEVVAVYETPPGRFTCPPTVPCLPRSEIPLLADPTRMIHAILRTQRSSSAFLHPGVVAAWVRAMLGGARQGAVDGDLGQLPAHLLVSEDGVVRVAHYGRHAADHIRWNLVEDFAKQPTRAALARAGAKPAAAAATRTIEIAPELYEGDVTKFNSWSAQPVRMRKPAPERTDSGTR